MAMAPSRSLASSRAGDAVVLETERADATTCAVSRSTIGQRVVLLQRDPGGAAVGETTTYSGSRSWATLAPGPNTRTSPAAPRGAMPTSKARKSAVRTVSSRPAAVRTTSMMLTLPSGSTE
jgi:hypothetical protein